MIKKLVLQNFRRHQDARFNFTPGLNVWRGLNESGKSSGIEAIAYACFGIKACRSPMSDLVTWGQPEKSLKVELTMEVDGVEYTITRSKAGAELTYGGDGRVVGQTEVARFIERLIGTGNDNVSKLMMASQGAIRGALDQGPGETMALIESLADFNVIDRVVDLVQEKRLTGPTATVEDRVGRAQEALTAAQASAVLIDTADLKFKLSDNVTKLGRMAEEAAKREPAVKAQLEKVSDAVAQSQLRASLIDQESNLKASLNNREKQIEQAMTASVPGEAPAEIHQVEQKIAEADKLAGLLAAYAEVDGLAKAYPDTVWEGDEPSFQKALQDSNQAVGAGQADVASLQERIKALNEQLQQGEGKCGSCGQLLPNAEAVAKHNAEIQQKLDNHKDEKRTAEALLAAERAQLADLLTLQKAAARYYAAATRHAANTAVDWKSVPPLIKWVGDKPQAVDGAALRARLTTLRKAVMDAAAAQVRVETLQAAQLEATTDMSKVEAKLGALGPDNLGNLRRELEDLSSQYNFYVNGANELKAVIANLQTHLDSSQAANLRQQQAVEDAAAAKSRAEQELADLHFNNTLLKRIRLARPIIADKLWSIVLSSVSAYFSSMRGTPSVVTRESKTFKVDGQEIGGLSGSTLDLLGLAIRLSLTRTFLPGAPFLILDEPAAAMDENREQSMLGFLVSAGFPQTLLVTHSDVESVAQNLITV